MSRSGVWVMAVLAAACRRSAPENRAQAESAERAASVAPMADAALKAVCGTVAAAGGRPAVRAPAHLDAQSWAVRARELMS